MKIAILGYSGSGKSTLAKHLKIFFYISVLYLDTVQFESNWKERNRKEAINIVSEFMCKSDWIIDGNYTSFLQSERLEQADYIIFLSFSRFNCLWRAYKRFLTYKHTTRESVAEGCNEKLDLEFVWWILYKGRTKEKINHYNSVLKLYRSKTIIIKNQKQLNDFINTKFDKIKQKK